MEYTKLVEQFRELARDILRMRWISNIMDNLAVFDRRIASLTKDNDERAKDVARATYRLSKLEETNPDFKELKETEDNYIKYTNECIESANKSIADLTKEKAEVAKEIAKVTSGELKVSADNLSAKAKELAEEWMKAQASKIKA
jgi:chromosome segregation ATPase